MIPTLNTTKRGNNSKMHKHLTTQNAINLHELMFFVCCLNMVMTLKPE